MITNVLQTLKKVQFVKFLKRLDDLICRTVTEVMLRVINNFYRVHGLLVEPFSS